MKSWIKFNLKHPKLMIGILLLITISALFGIRLIQFDSSVEVLMPKSDPIYRLGQRVKVVFGDSKTFTIVSVEPVKGKRLFSKQIFSVLDRMVSELEEYKEFDKEKEDQRLNAILNLGNISIQKQAALIKPTPRRKEKITSKNRQTEEELDLEILEGRDAKGSIETETTQNGDIFDLAKSNLLPTEREPLRKRNIYNYEKYKIVSLSRIRKNIDNRAYAQLQTILKLHGMGIQKNDKADHNFTKSQYQKIVESWEDIYLYKSVEIIKTLLDPISIEDIHGSKNELRPVDLIPKDENGKRILPQSEEDFEIYKKELLKNPLFESSIFARDAKGRFRAFGINFILRYRENHSGIRNYLWHLLDKYNQDPVKLNILGSLIFNKFMNENSQRDMSFFVPLVILVVIITFALNFRSARGVILPTLTVIIATLWTMGLMGFLGIKLSIIGTIIPTLLIAVGSSYAIHIFNQYLLDLEDIREDKKGQGLEKSLSHISTTVALAGVTTFIGFSTLTVSQVTGLRDFGIFAAIGTIFSMIVSVTLISSSLKILKLLPPKIKKEKQNGNILVRKIVNFFSHFSLNHSRVVFVVAAISIVLGIIGTSMVTTETTPTKYFKEGSYIREASKKIGDLFNGSFVFNVVIDSQKEDGIKEPEFLNFVQGVQDWLDKKEQREGFNILHNTSFTDMIKRMHKAMNEDSHEYYKIPESRTTITDYLEIFSGEDDDSDGRPDAFETTIDKDWRRINLIVRIGQKHGKMVSTELTRRARDHILNHLDNTPNPGGYTWFIVGNPVNFIVLSEYILKGQIQTIILSILIVGFIISLLFRNIYAGLVALIPISVSILMVFGVMGALGIPLDIAQAILSSVAIGIGVDDTIHFLNTLRKKLNEGHPLKDAIQRTYNEAGLAIVYTSIALVFGFIVLMFSSFNPIFYFGFLVSSVMVATTLSALLVLPTVIYFFKIPLEKESNAKIFKIINIRKIFE